MYLSHGNTRDFVQSCIEPESKTSVGRVPLVLLLAQNESRVKTACLNDIEDSKNENKTSCARELLVLWKTQSN